MGQKTTTHEMGSAAPKRTTPQKIVICIDGTGQDKKPRKGGGTNVKKFAELLQTDKADQTVIYLAGVGSKADKKKSGKRFGISGGSGAKRLRYKALAELTLNYMPGDEIFIVGFSRGAAICRTLANSIHKEGIPETIKIVHKDKAFCECRPAKGAKLHRPQIEMLGLFDTVASFGVGADIAGMPFHKINLFKNFTIAPNIKQAYHLLSIDEQRDAFLPTLMNAEDRVSETWFAGVHTDVGGGYAEHGLSDITLTYLINRARSHGLQFDDARVEGTKPLKDQDKDKTKVAPDCCAPLHERFRFLGYKLGHRKIKVKVLPSKKAATDLRPKLHKSVYARMKAAEASFITKKKGITKRKYQPDSVEPPISKNYRVDSKD